MSSEAPDSGQDRRRHPRVPTDLKGTLQCDGETQCKVLNVSRSGAFAVSSQALPEMAQVQIRLEVAAAGQDPRSLTCEAAVVRCDRRPDGNYDLGLFFTSMTDEDTELLSRIIESQTIPTSI